VSFSHVPHLFRDTDRSHSHASSPPSHISITIPIIISLILPLHDQLLIIIISMKPLSEGIQRMIESNIARSSSGSGGHQEDEKQSESSSESDETEIDESDDEANDSEDESSFKNQVSGVTQWIGDLSPCQQVVSVLSLLTCLNQSQRTFILNHMNHNKQQNVDPENSVRESDANRLSFWQQFFQSNPNPGKEQMIDLLLEKLPLVSPVTNSSNSSLTLLYLHLITSSLNAVTSSPNPASKQVLEKCRDLLSLSFVTAVFSPEQKKNFLNPFTAKLMIQSNENAYIQSTLRSSIRRSDNRCDTGLGSSGSSIAAVPVVRAFSGPGMSGVAPYLKALRLHKYTPLFASLPSLNHFINLTDGQLEDLGVAAKGARKKFIQSLAKLKARPDLLKSLFHTRCPADILPVISDVISTPLSKDSPEVTLILHLLLKGLCRSSSSS
jgi:hypothetical protein